jgi:thiol:disulfide interchange protein
MREKAACFLFLILASAVNVSVASADSVINSDVVTISIEQQYETVAPDSNSALAFHFEMKKSWHFYASAETAPGGMNLKIKPSVETKDVITFSQPIFPSSHSYFDKTLNEKIEVFSGNFTVFLPFHVGEPRTAGTYTDIDIEIGIEGAVCSDVQCRVPDFGKLSSSIKIAPVTTKGEAKFVLPKATEQSKPVSPVGVASYSVWFALGLAFLAGLSLNIMPCVWPVLPVIVLRLVEQAKQDKSKSIVSGLFFCLGILLFFASLAAANIVLQVFYGQVLQWGDQFRSPAFVTAMAILLVVLALFMFDIFTVTVPSSVAAKSGSGKGYLGTVGMGFLAAILSTPCSFAILAAAFAWAQAQPLLLAAVAIMVIGVGMAAPYVILTSMPGLLSRLPKAGRWMELFKQGIGFVLLGIAVKLIGAVPQTSRIGVLYFAVALGFCVWMWGGWVSYDTKLSRKWLIRTIAIALAVAAGWSFLRAPAKELIDWQGYDANLIETARTEGKPVLIKFTADWCLSCQAAEKIVFSRKDIAELIKSKGILAIKADTTTNDSPATAALKNVYNEPGVPVTFLFTPGRKGPVIWRGISFANELKSLLEKLPSK